MTSPASKAPCLGCESDAQPVACGVATINAFMSCAMLFALDPKQAAHYIAAFCPEHGHQAAMAVVALASRNGMSVEQLTAKLYVVFGMGFTCPRCGATSHNPNDVREGYCGRCHEWTRVDSRKEPSGA